MKSGTMNVVFVVIFRVFYLSLKVKVKMVSVKIRTVTMNVIFLIIPL